MTLASVRVVHIGPEVLAIGDSRTAWEQPEGLTLFVQHYYLLPTTYYLFPATDYLYLLLPNVIYIV